jgi:hypothetical protein
VGVQNLASPCAIIGRLLFGTVVMGKIGLLFSSPGFWQANLWPRSPLDLSMMAMRVAACIRYQYLARLMM